MNCHNFKNYTLLTPDITKQPQTTLESIKRQIKVQQNMAIRGNYAHNLMVKF